MSNPKYDINNFSELFSEIGYAFEAKYPPRRDNYNGVDSINFYKLYLNEKGEAQYKADCYTFDPQLWGKVVKLYELLKENQNE